jgi:hypothetical protein
LSTHDICPYWNYTLAPGQLDASKPAQLRNFSRYFPSVVVGPTVADLEVGFELRQCEMFPFLGLLQEAAIEKISPDPTPA